MRKKLLIGLGVVAGLVLVFLVIVALQPGEYRISRSATIEAPPQAAFAKVNDFHRWSEWSPWAKLDPHMEESYSGPADGRGAHYHWVGNDEVGEGQMTITDSRPGELVLIDLEFIKPFASKATTEFRFQPENEGTKVTWSMTGRHGFVEKAFCLFMNMDAMVGKDFEKGLAQMKTAVEKK